ncbi:MAG: prepilin-type N-terminal cleavage/methylation domain-containing protein [Magnetococcus sp. WYHC-3]
MRRPNRPDIRAGFSLLELSIVLVILGLIVSASIGLFTPSSRYLYDSATEKLLDANVEALVGYASVYRRLPVNQSEYNATVRKVEDGYGRGTLYYLAGGRDAGGGSVNLSDPNGVCNAYATNTSLVTRDSNSTIVNVAALIHSIGYDNGTDFTNVTAGGNITWTLPAYVSGVNDQASASDDFVSWVTLNELKAAARCSSDLDIYTAGVPAGVNNTAYGSTSQFSPRTSIAGATYSWCVESNALAQPVGSLYDILELRVAGVGHSAVNNSQCANAGNFRTGGSISLLDNASNAANFSLSGSWPLQIFMNETVNGVTRSANRMFYFTVTGP